MVPLRRLSVILLPAAFLTPALVAQPVTTDSLIAEMVDMHRLAEFPEPAFRTVQFSSFDHSSTVPGGPHWFANADGFGGEPIPNFEAVLTEPGEDGVGEYLICDVVGPGAIVRCWTAAIAGSIRVYLDGADDPVFSGSADDFLRRPFDVFARQVGLDPAVFDGTFNQQNATYCPLPFAKRCRIEWTGKVKDIHFYEVQVRLYAPGARVVTFRPDDLKTAAATIARVAAVLREPSSAWEYATPPEKALPIVATIDPGQSVELLRLEGKPGALERLTLRAHAGDLDRALRQTVLHVVCDGHPWGQVQSPLGDFFGAAPGVNPFDSVPFTVAPDGAMTCRFVMPYESSLVIRAANRGEEPVSITGTALPQDYRWTDRSMHFRARWRVDHDLLADPQAVIDLPFLVAGGRGRYVGTASLLLNPTDAPSPYGGWWGEGDEKIFVDDDVRPSTFGTGSEDYFNYAWSIPDIFGFAYCGQPRDDGPGNRGFVTNQRWHVLDSLPFQSRLAFYMELYPHLPTPGFSYARLAYHYARPGLVDDHVPITDADLRMLKLPPDWRPIAALGSANSTFHQAEDLLEVANDCALSFVEDDLFAGSGALIWLPAAPGEDLTFELPVPAAGKYQVSLVVLKNGSSGEVRIWLERPGEEAGGARLQIGAADLRAPWRRHLRRIQTREMEFEKGTYRLGLTSVGGALTEIGIDFIWVQRR